MKDLHIDIVGMTCEHCIRAVNKRLTATPGVTVKSVELNSVDIALDESKTSMADIEEAISDVGYTVDSVSAR